VINKKRIFFIADDDQDDKELFINALQQIDEHFTYITASDGEEALKKLLDITFQLPEIIFLDLNMPKINGKQCLIKIKENKTLQDIPVIMYSTTADKKEMEEINQLGAAFFLQKPNRFDELCNALEKIVNVKWNVVL